MKILILSGVFDRENEQAVLAQARRAVEFSANLMQEKIIAGFRALDSCEVTVLSAPFLGAYPTASSTFVFRGFDAVCTDYTYVPFCNLWGVRNFSRARALKRALRPFLREEDEQKLILAYCPHTPFLKAADYAKRRDKHIRSCLYVPDLPEFMNLSDKISPIYKFAKAFDIRSMRRAMRSLDSFVLLTEQMKDRLPVGDKPYLVSEALLTDEALEQAKRKAADPPAPACGTRNIVYTGKLDARFGAKDLIDSMEHLPDQDLRLVLAGTGDALEYAKARSARDMRIRVLGQITPAEAEELRQTAAVLVNPRSSREEYTNYSFPSKNAEYLLPGKSVVAYLLPGMPAAYRDFLCVPQAEGAAAIAEAVRRALALSPEERCVRHLNFLHYAETHLLASRVAESILHLGE